jgi:GDP-L-fucose synthase
MDKNSKIYVAGHSGMVGSAIVRELYNQGYNNILVRTHEELDLTKQIDVEDFFKENHPEYVFMAAAKVGGIKANSEYPVDFLMENLKIQSNIFENSNKYKINKLLFLGSSCIYPKECQQPIKEEFILSGLVEVTNEPYAIAKIAGIKACEYYNRQFGTNFIGVMPANSYGFNDCFDPEKSHVIPALIRKYYEAKKLQLDKIVLWGTGTPLREFLYVDDLADACIFLMNNYDGKDVLNIGTDSEISILELSQIIKRIVGYEGNIECDVQKPDGMMRRIVDSSKIHKLGWSAKTSIEEGITKTYKYFLDKVL